MHRYSHGTTLLEMVVALAVLSLCMLAMYQALTFGTQVWGRSLLAHANEGDVGLTRDFVSTRLGALARFTPPDSSVPVMSGSFEEVEFSSSPPLAFGLGELRYALRLKRSRSGADLVIRWRRVWDGRADRVAGLDWHEETLLTDVRRLSIDYLVDEPGGAHHWESAWHEQKHVPALIRLTVFFPHSDRRHWEPIVVHPQIDADSLCEFDPVSQSCRDL